MKHLYVELFIALARVGGCGGWYKTMLSPVSGTCVVVVFTFDETVGGAPLLSSPGLRTCFCCVSCVCSSDVCCSCDEGGPYSLTCKRRVCKVLLFKQSHTLTAYRTASISTSLTNKDLCLCWLHAKSVMPIAVMMKLEQPFHPVDSVMLQSKDKTELLLK